MRNVKRRKAWRNGKQRSVWTYYPSPELRKVGLLSQVEFDDWDRGKYWFGRWNKWADDYFNQSTFNGLLERWGYEESSNYYDISRLRSVFQHSTLSHNSKPLGEQQVRWLTEHRAKVFLSVIAGKYNNTNVREIRRTLARLLDYGVEQELLEENVLRNFTQFALIYEDQEVEPIPQEDVDKILLFCFSFWEYRNHGISMLISYDAQIPCRTDLTWDELKHLDLSEATMVTLSNHEKDWGFQPYVTPSLITKDNQYVPLKQVEVYLLFQRIMKTLHMPYQFQQLRK